MSRLTGFDPNRYSGGSCRVTFPPSGYAAFAQVPGFHETGGPNLDIKRSSSASWNSKFAQMHHRVDDIIDVRARLAGAPPDEPSLGFQRDAAGV